jgi:hypothetical protein
VPRSPADLRKTFAALDHLLYDDRFARDGVRVKWKRFRKAKNFMMFGDYDGELKEIRLNYRLAQDDVPNYVVAAVLNHEMLHHILGYEHTVEFMKADAAFIHYWDSEAWCDRVIMSECSVEE